MLTVNHDLLGKFDQGFETDSGNTIFFADIISITCSVEDSSFKIEFHLQPGSGMFGYFRDSCVFVGAKAFEIYTKYLTWEKARQIDSLKYQLKKIDPKLTVVLEDEQ